VDKEFACAENGFLDRVEVGEMLGVVFSGPMGVLEGVFHGLEGGMDK
jgi:hypothetical protein